MSRAGPIPNGTLGKAYIWHPLIEKMALKSENMSVETLTGDWLKAMKSCLLNGICKIILI